LIAGITIVTNRAMIATTTSNSTKVNADRFIAKGKMNKNPTLSLLSHERGKNSTRFRRFCQKGVCVKKEEESNARSGGA
jgi:hypothetical protein